MAKAAAAAATEPGFFWHMFDVASIYWVSAKTFFEHMIGFSHDALHVMAGVCLQLVFSALLRTSLRHPGPWFTVLGLELANEGADLWIEVWPDHAMQWGESAKDVLLTMALPSVLMVASRFWPRLLHADQSRSPAVAAAADIPDEAAEPAQPIARETS